MSKNRNRRHASSSVVTAEVMPDPKAVVANALAQAQTTIAQVQNDLASAIGLGGGMIPSGFPQNQGNPLSEQVSQPTTIFKNLRWYLVSNMRQVLSEAYVELGLVQAIVDLPVDDGLRGGIEIKSQQLSEEQIQELLVSLDRDNDLVTAGQAAKWNRLFGGAGIIVLTDQDPEEPLDLKTIDKNTPLEFRAADMWELFWDKQNTEGYDPTIQEESFETYNYYGEPIHKSRVMRLKGIEAPSFIRPRLRGWGFSVVEILVRSINQYLKATDLAFEVLDEFKVDVYKIKNLTGSLFSDAGERAIQRRVQLANYQKNYQNAITMDSEDDWDHKQLSFAGLGDAMLQIRMQVASDMRMPLTKLFGISAAGFNSGEDDIEVYNAMVESQVRNKLKYDLLRICEIKCQKLFGMIPDDMTLAFKPLRVMSAEQEENVKNAKFARLLQALQAGQIDQKTFKDAINKENLLGVTLDTSQDTLDDAVEDGEGEDTDDEGAGRADSEKPKAAGAGGAPKGLAKASVVKSKEAPQAKTQNADKFDESKHPRADDGKFGKGGGSDHVAAQKKAVAEARETGALRYKEPTQAEKDADFEKAIAKLKPHEQEYERDKRVIMATEFKTRAEASAALAVAQDKYEKAKGGGAADKGKSGGAEMKAFKEKYPAHSGDTFESKGTKDEATAKARKLREEGIHATIAHMEGPKTGAKSKYFVMVPEGKGDEAAPESKVKTPKPESLPEAGKKVDGREIMEGAVPNLDSIGSTLDDYEVLPGIKEISTDLFTYTPPYSASEMKRTKELAEKIKASGVIAPLIVVNDSEGYYVLEGGHRFDALSMLGAKSFPCVVVKDIASLESAEKTENAPAVMPKQFNGFERALRSVNSAAFDRASYAADGGDDWIDKRREELFSGDKAQDKALWRKAEEASSAALGAVRWQFVVWAYKKAGGSFH